MHTRTPPPPRVTLPGPPQGADLELSPVADILARALGRAADPPSFLPILDGVREALTAVGLPAHRVQVPMTRAMGFRHPTLAVVLLTWTDDRGYADTEVIPHSTVDARATHSAIGTPFEPLLMGGLRTIRHRLAAEDSGYPLLRALRERGFVDYCAIAVRMPSGDRQPFSVASREPFPDDVADRLLALDALLALYLYGAYRTSQAVRLAQAYIGHKSGPRVLAGEIKRGSTTTVEAGVMFCDLRGFTRLSEELGAEGVVEVMNEVFDRIGGEALTRGGEILKFIGDAMLLVFPVNKPEERAVVAAALVDTARAGAARVAELSERLGRPLAVGFGAHIGQVVQGNVGTSERLDFTVMGPAVNLASRLESLSKDLHAYAVFSQQVADLVPGLPPSGAHQVRGISAPVPTWALRDPAQGEPGHARAAFQETP